MSIVVTHERGKRFAAQVRSHQVFTDQPLKASGNDSAPTPLELLGAALGSCVALYVQQFCASRDIPYEGIRVEVDQVGAQNPHRIGSFDLRVVLPAELTPQNVVLIERVVHSCPVHATLAHTPAVATQILQLSGIT
jgi:putative redox protein